MIVDFLSIEILVINAQNARAAESLELNSKPQISYTYFINFQLKLLEFCYRNMNEFDHEIDGFILSSQLLPYQI